MDKGASADADRATHEQSPQAVSAVPVGIPSAARDLFLEFCPAGDRGTLQRYGVSAAIEAISAALNRDRLIALLSAELGDSYDCTRVWSAWGYGTMDEDDFEPVENRVHEMADGIISALLAQAIEARRAETGTGSVHESAVRQDAPIPSVPSTPIPTPNTPGEER